MHDDLERLVNCTTDVKRPERMRHRSGSNQVAIRELSEVLSILASPGDDMLIARLSARRAALEQPLGLA